MDKTYSVIEVTRILKDVIENSIPTVEIEGEISNYKAHYSGHAYFTLKDDFAQISAVMWKSSVDKLPFDLEDGMKVVCKGKITLYEKSGRYQVSVQSMEEAGVGDLQKRFELLKKELLELGYFDSEIKQTIPVYPTRIGLVTSPTGAALQDMISVAERRNPAVQLILRPAKVQGKGAAEEVAEGIKEFNEYGNVDVIIIGRGGGSLEDLWAFNERVLADAIYDSSIPIISAVGHEIDFSISDFVADKRAATPTAATEIAIPDRSEMMGQILYYQDKIHQLVTNKLEVSKETLERFKSHYALKQPELIASKKRDQLNRLKDQVKELYSQLLRDKMNDITTLRKQLHALNPENVLKRGFAVIKQNNKIITRVSELENEETIFQFADGTVNKKLSE